MDYIRVNKPTARKMFRAGYEIKLLPCKVNSAVAFDPQCQGHFWINPLPIKHNSRDHLVQFEDKSIRQCDTFDRTVNAYIYYNCNAEVGYYPHYYVTEGDYKLFKEEYDNGTQKEVPV